MKVILALALPLAAAVTQSSLGGQLALGEARPDLLALVVLSWALVAGAEALWWAFVGGLGGDLLGAGVFGALTVSLLPLSGLFALRAAAPPGVLAGAALVGLGAFAHQGLYAAVVFLVGRPLPDLPALAGALGAGAAYTGVLAVVAYPSLRALRRHIVARAALDY